MRRCSFIISIVSLHLSAGIFASQPTIHIIKKVDNPEHYKKLASQNEFIKQIYEDWKISSIGTPMEQNKLVFFYLNLKVPKSIAPLGNSYDFGLWLKFSGDSLTNFDEIKNCKMQLEEVIEHIENHKAIRTFRSNTTTESEYLYWNGGYIFQIRSTNYDTLVCSFRLPALPGEGHVWWFSFYSPHLLDLLEVFMGAAAYNLIPEFGKKVGLGHVRSGKQELFVSSDINCSGMNSCFTFSGSQVQSFKLSMEHDWSKFPFFAKAFKELQYYLIIEGNRECLTAETTDKLFAIMCPPRKGGPRRVYLPWDCENELVRIISFQIEGVEEYSQEPIIQNISVLDSLIDELR